MKHTTDISQTLDYGLDTHNRVIFLDMVDSDSNVESGEVNHLVASRFLRSLHVLESLGRGNIRINLTSEGGCWTAGMVIYDAIMQSRCHTEIVVYGEASSMASVILQAADTRSLMPNAILLLHDGQTKQEGVIRNVEKMVEHERKERLKMYQIYADRSGQPKKYFSRKLQGDWILTAEEALEEGLADKIY